VTSHLLQPSFMLDEPINGGHWIIQLPSTNKDRASLDQLDDGLHVTCVPMQAWSVHDLGVIHLH